MSHSMYDDKVEYAYQMDGGKHWSLMMRRGMCMRLTDLEGGANVGMLFYNPENLLERFNAPDTLKCQHTFKLTRGNCLYSDMGRIFASIIEDTHGWHDSVCGNLTDAHIHERWAHQDYQSCHNDWTLSGHTSCLVELAKYGLGKADLAANLNLFSRVDVADDGGMTLNDAASRPGQQVVLRFEMDTLVILHTCPHPLNAAAAYPRKPVNIELLRAKPVAEDDYCRQFRPENARGFENNRLYYLGAE